MKREDGKRRRERWLGLYTGLYLCGALTLCLIMALYRRRLIWGFDGVKQHYTVLGYVAQVARGLLAGERPPMLSFSLGQGLDVLTTCGYYGYTDPLSRMAALATPDSLELAYVGIALLRNYLAGLCFAAYAKKVGARDGWALGCSAAIYVYSGYFLYMLGRHPYFINGALYLPLMLLGVERVLDGRRWLLYTLVTTLMLVANFYFAYMNTVVAVIYILLRLAFRLRQRGVGESAKDGFMLLGGYLLGLALSAVVLYPVALLYLRNGRYGAETGYGESLLRYPLRHYRKMIENAFLSWRGGDSYTYLGYLPLALPGLMELFTVRGRRARLPIIGLCACLVGACVPAVGKVMNGMAYVSNRWIYVMAMFVALGCCFGLPRLLSRRPRAWIGALAALYGLAIAWLNRRRPGYLVESALILALAALMLAWAGGERGWLTRRRVRGLLTGLLALSVVLYSAMVYLPMGEGYIDEQAQAGVYAAVAAESKGQLIDDDGVFRVDQARFDDANSLLLGYMGSSFYWSLVDGAMSEYYTDLWLPMLQTSDHLYGLYANTPMNAVAAVKYAVRSADNASLVPYGFEGVDGALALPGGGEARLYENAYALPLGYAYDTQLSKADYDALPVEGKLRALTHCAIVEESVEALPAAGADAFSDAAQELPFEIVEASGVTLAEGAFHAEEGGRLKLAFDAPEDCEVYLLAEGAAITWASSKELWVRVGTETGECDALLRNPTDNYYFPRKGVALCLGHDAPKGCELLFYNNRTADGVYRSLRVVAIPLDGYREDMEARRREGLEDVALSKDALRATISVSGDRALQIALPYSEGWRAWVDGVEQPVFRCGGMYMGIALGAGRHQIEMRYVTPGLKLGAAISGAALLATLTLAVVSAVRKRRGGRTRV